MSGLVGWKDDCWNDYVFGFLTNLPMELTAHAIANIFTYMKLRKQMVS